VRETNRQKATSAERLNIERRILSASIEIAAIFLSQSKAGGAVFPFDATPAGGWHPWEGLCCVVFLLIAPEML